jgi:ATP-binding cassette subfamily B (MDR/TAP) protein 10
MMGIVPPIALFAVVYGRFVSRISRETTNASAELTKFGEGRINVFFIISLSQSLICDYELEKISNIRTVRAFARDSYEIDAYKEHVNKVYNLAMSEGKASGVFFGSVSLFLCAGIIFFSDSYAQAGFSGNIAILALLYYGGSMVQSGELTVGELTSFFLYTAYVGSSLIGLSSWYSELMKGVGASARLFSLLEEKSLVETSFGIKFLNVLNFST